MPTGRRSSRKRPRNDLDDYLDEVDSLLFCVTSADRQCLNRDLKAHVRELTIDPRSSNRYQGRYGITKTQLWEDVGEPSVIADNYIASVGRKIPSQGLHIFTFFMIGIFITSLVIGIDRYQVSQVEDITNSTWLRSTSVVYILVGSVALFVTVFAIRKFERYHTLFAYLGIISIALSILASGFFAGFISTRYHWRDKTAAHDLYSTLFIFDFIIIGMIGVYIYLKHYRVMNSKRELTI